MEGRYIELLELIYEAALEPEAWRLFLERFSDAMGGGGAMLFLHRYADRHSVAVSGDYSFITHARTDETFVASFQEHYSQANVWLENAKYYGEGVPVTSSLLYEDAALPKTEFYNDWLRPQNFFYSIGGAILQRDDVSVRLTSLRPAKAGPYSEAELALYQRLMPHLKRACQVQLRLAESRVLERAGIAGLDKLAFAAFLLDQHGSVLSMNAAAEALLQQKDGLTIGAKNQLVATAPGERQALNALIASSIGTSTGVGVGSGGVMALPRQHSEQPMSLLVAPLPGAPALIERRPCALVFATVPEVNATTRSIAALSTLYGLSATEARLTAALAAGETLEQYAESREVSLHTARTQLKHVLRKTATQRQAELVKLALTSTALMVRQ